ncbi:MAG: YgjP-like metallopeptidase domain-containing protein [Mariprofundales bacterium]
MITDLPDYRLRESRRAKRVSLRLLPPYGEIEVVIPSGHDAAVAPLLVEQHRQWINEQQKKFTEKVWVSPTEIDLPAINHSFNITYNSIDNASNIKVKCIDNDWMVTGAVSNRNLVAVGLQHHLKTFAKKVLITWLWQLVDQRCAPYGLKPSRVTVRLQQSRWGSCSARGGISLNAKLLLLPPALVDHIILHELAHLRVHNHSQAYWDFLTLLDPEWRQHRVDLRQAEATMPAWVRKTSC